MLPCVLWFKTAATEDKLLTLLCLMRVQKPMAWGSYVDPGAPRDNFWEDLSCFRDVMLLWGLRTCRGAIIKAMLLTSFEVEYEGLQCPPAGLEASEKLLHGASSDFHSMSIHWRPKGTKLFWASILPWLASTCGASKPELMATNRQWSPETREDIKQKIPNWRLLFLIVH